MPRPCDFASQFLTRRHTSLLASAGEETGVALDASGVTGVNLRVEELSRREEAVGAACLALIIPNLFTN